MGSIGRHVAPRKGSWMRTETERRRAGDASSVDPQARPGVRPPTDADTGSHDGTGTDAPLAEDPAAARQARRRHRMVGVAVWPYRSVRAWVLRRRKVIDLRDRGLNAGVGLTDTATRPDEPSDPAASGAGRATGTTG
jgi:hypothetical protein